MSVKLPIAAGGRRQLLRRERFLPVPGELLVAVGQRVRPDDVIGRCLAVGLPVTIPVSSLLGEPGIDITTRLLKQKGDRVAAGDVLAVRKGFLGRDEAVVRSPEDGVITTVLPTKGHVVIGPVPESVDLRSGFAGTVVGTIPERAAIIEMAVLYLQGLVSFGPEVWGPLAAGAAPDSEVEIAARHSGAIVFGGRASTNTIRSAAQAGVRALVVGGVDVDSFARLRAGELAGITVVITEGVGAAGLARRTFAELLSVEPAETNVSAGPTHWHPSVRPEVIVAIDPDGALGFEPLVVRQGSEVRVVAGPRFGRCGWIVDMPARPRRTATGAYVLMAEVELSDGQIAEVPLSNLELMG